MPTEAWETRLARVWARADELPEQVLVARVDALALELEDEDGAGPFEQAAVRDSTGDPRGAVPLYRQALAQGLQGERRRRAVIQLASSLRTLGQADDAVALLEAELRRPSDDLDDAVRAFLALALTDLGRAREAVSLALTALAPRLPRYQRSLAEYARLLLDERSS